MSDSTLLVTETAPALMTWGHELDGDGQPFVEPGLPVQPHAHAELGPSFERPRHVPLGHREPRRRRARRQAHPREVDPRPHVDASPRDRLARPRRSAPGRSALSWFLGQHRGRRIVSHGGGDTGYITDLVLVPEGRKAVVWMMNVDFVDPAPITRAALDVALGLEPQPIVSKRSVASSADGRLPADGGLDAALEAATRAQGEPGRHLRPRRGRAQHARLLPARREARRRGPARLPDERRGLPASPPTPRTASARPTRWPATPRPPGRPTSER